VAFTLIRHNVLNDQEATQQTQVDGNSLEIGRGSGNALLLDDLHISQRHAVIEYVDGHYVIKDLDSRGGTYVNHRAVRMQPLADGDVVHIGNYNLRMDVPANAGPLTVDVTREGTEEVAENTASVSYLSHYRLADSVFTKKRLTWWGLGLIVGGMIVLLLLGEVPLGKKVWYASTILAPGEVTPAHGFIGHNCVQCHADAWRVPTSNACNTCHTGLVHQASESFTPDCVTCHREHRSDHKALTTIGDQFCVQCHGDLRTKGGQAPQFATQIRGFDTGHPEFSVIVAGQNEQKSARVKLSDKAALRDTSAIRLNHQKHLNPERIKKLSSKTLTCTNCHKMDAQGAYMLPIAYAEHCAECHPLEFDERFRGQFVEHGKQPEDIQEFLKDNFYTARCLEQAGLPTPPPSSPEGSAGVIRRPGQAPSAPQQPQVATPTTVIQCRDREVREAEKRLYAGGNQSICGYCHTLQDPSPGHQLPTVVRPEIPPRWFMHGKFDHQAHIRATTLKATAANKNPCELCHRPDFAASKSTETSDVLLPGIASCQECHSSAGGVSSQCVTCHQYHERRVSRVSRP
jgi:predicted CXXCH cytochrome family protein